MTENIIGTTIQNKRDGQTAKVMGFTEADSTYLIQTADRALKHISIPTFKRWWKVLEEANSTADAESEQEAAEEKSAPVNEEPKAEPEKKDKEPVTIKEPREVTEAVISKIQKLLNLSLNNPSEAEAQAAALKAQKIMAEYGVKPEDLENGEAVSTEEIKIARTFVDVNRAWKYRLANIVAANFRCKCFSSDSRWIMFYGYETDAAIAKETFDYLFAVGNKKAFALRNSELKSTGKMATILNSFTAGFCAGVESKLNEQCQALMIVTSEEVKSGFADYSKNFTKGKHCLRGVDMSGEAYEKGHQEGRNAVGSRQIGA
jgi:hypothetical protein